MHRTENGVKNLLVVAATLTALLIGNLLIRHSYVSAGREFRDVHTESRLMQARSIATSARARIRSMEIFMGAVAGYPQIVGGATPDRLKLLGEMLPYVAEIGIRDLYWIEPQGEMLSPGGTILKESREIMLARKVGRADEHHPWVKGGLSYVTREGKREKGIAVVAPVPEGGHPAAGWRPAGFLVALAPASSLFDGYGDLRKSRSAYVSIIDEDGVFVYHPDPAYIGAEVSGAMDFARFGRLKKVMGKLTAGKEGAGLFKYFDSAEGKRAVEWQLVYSPTRVRGRMWSVGIMEELSVSTAARQRFWTYTAAALLFSLVTAGTGALVFVGGRRIDSLSRQVKELQDASALSGILRSVNQELAEAKQALEGNAEDYGRMIARVQVVAGRLTDAVDALIELVRRPTREQKESMRDVRFEASHLKGEIRRMHDRCHGRKDR